MSKARIKQLEEAIRYHNNLYWNKHAPEISDQAYDALVNELLSLDPNNTVPFEFDEAVDAGNAVTHDELMLSIDKAYSIAEILKWARKLTSKYVTISPKMDGSACSIKFINGKLVLAATRGKGKIGKDVTSAAKLIGNVPKQIDYKDPIEVRGEVCVNNSDFKKLTGDHANSRNTATGALKRENPNDPKHNKVPLTFYAYNVIGSDRDTESDKFKFLREQGFRHVATKSVLIKDLERALKDFEAERNSWDYEVDGLIIMAGDVAEQDKLGYTRHHPRYAMALKFQGESGQTILEDIEASVSRTGQITPVGIVKPINLSGATITRVSIHHYGFVESKNLTKGATVEMTRRGSVIPQLEQVIIPGKGGKFEEPDRCPVCGAATERRDDFLYCTGDACPAQIAGQIEHFVKVLEIDGMGSKIIDQICRHGIKNPAHLFQMTEGGLIRNVDRMGQKGAKKIIDNIQAKRQIPLNVFLRSLGIHELGHHVSEELAKVCKSVPDVMVLKRSDLLALPKVGDTIAESVLRGLKENDDLIRHLLKFITIAAPAVKATGILSGKSFVFTGTLIRMKRPEAQKKAQALGADTPSSVRKTLTHLVVGGKDRTSSKCVKAQKFIDEGASLEIISEMDFVNIINGD